MKIILIFLIVCVFLVACSPCPNLKPHATVFTAPPPPVANVHKIASWADKETVNTEMFTAQSRPWAITWQFVPDWTPRRGLINSGQNNCENIFELNVNNTDGSLLKKLVTVRNTTDTEQNYAFIDVQGTFYLQVISTNGSWAVMVYGN